VRVFLDCTTSEKKNGFLLIETFKKLFNLQNDGHLDQLYSEKEEQSFCPDLPLQELGQFFIYQGS
jgi:hypothetical protein